MATDYGYLWEGDGVYGVYYGALVCGVVSLSVSMAVVWAGATCTT